MKFHPSIPVYGDQSYRGDCPSEQAEQVAFFDWLARTYPEIDACTTHVRNEGKRSATRAHIERLEGMRAGFADIIVAGAPALLIELKRRDHTKSRWQPRQVERLLAARAMGAWVAVALGADAAAAAIVDYANNRKR